MTHGRHHRDRHAHDGSHHLFEVEGPEVFRGSTSSSNDDHVHGRYATCLSVGWVRKPCCHPQATGHLFCGPLALNEHTDDGPSQTRPAVFGQAKHVGFRSRRGANHDGDMAWNGGKQAPWPIKHAFGLQGGDEFPSLGLQFAHGVYRMDGRDLKLNLAARRIQVHASNDHDLGSFLKI